jgi:hypothetical protein
VSCFHYVASRSINKWHTSSTPVTGTPFFSKCTKNLRHSAIGIASAPHYSASYQIVEALSSPCNSDSASGYHIATHSCYNWLLNKVCKIYFFLTLFHRKSFFFFAFTISENADATSLSVYVHISAQLRAMNTSVRVYLWYFNIRLPSFFIIPNFYTSLPGLIVN